jgi:hypothetical protein
MSRRSRTYDGGSGLPLSTSLPHTHEGRLDGDAHPDF